MGMNSTIRNLEQQLAAHYASFPARTARVLRLVALLANEPARPTRRRDDDYQLDVEREAEQQGVTVADYLSDGQRSAG
jgi:hypothetical protein